MALRAMARPISFIPEYHRSMRHPDRPFCFALDTIRAPHIPHIKRVRFRAAQSGVGVELLYR